MTLDVGPGHNWQPHGDQPVVRLDLRKETSPSVMGDARSLPFRTGSFSTVYASHVLEHFSRRESLTLLKEWVRVLSSGGELQLFVPNLEWSALQIVNGIADEFVMNALYGRQDNHVDHHLTGFTPSVLTKLLSELPLELEDIRTFRNSICVWAVKNA